MRGCVYISA